MPKKFAEIRVSEGVDYLKIFIGETDNEIQPKQEWQQAIKDTAESYNKTTVSHATSFAAQRVAREVGGKFITHSPTDKALDEAAVNEMLDNN